MRYQFKCEQCKKSFELTMTLAQFEAKQFSCPQCNSKKLSQQLGEFAPSTSKHIIPRGTPKRQKKKAKRKPLRYTGQYS